MNKGKKKKKKKKTRGGGGGGREIKVKHCVHIETPLILP